MTLTAQHGHKHIICSCHPVVFAQLFHFWVLHRTHGVGDATLAWSCARSWCYPTYGAGVKDMQYTTAQSTIITWNVWEKRIDSTKDVAFLFWLAKWLLRWGAPFILIQSLPFCNILQCFLSRRYKTPQRLQHIHFQNARNLHGPFWALAPCFYFRLDCSDFSMCWKVTACVSSDWPLYNFKQVLLGQQSEWIKPIATTSCPKVG